MSSGWEEVGRLIAAERARRWPSRVAFAHAAGVSRRVLDDIESAARTNYRDATLGQIEAALGWEPGEIRARVEGRRPARPADRQMRRIQDAWPHLSRDAKQILADLADGALRRT